MKQKKISLDGRIIFFDSLGNAIPKFCTYCGSDRLTEGKLTQYNSIKCLNCGMFIHDCCSQNDISQLEQIRRNETWNESKNNSKNQ